MWFQLNTNTSYGRTYWWDGTFTDTSGSYQTPLKTSVGGIRRLSAFSTNGSATNAGNIYACEPQDPNFLSIDYSGCSQLATFNATIANYVLSSLNFTGCTNLVTINLNEQYALSSLNITGCPKITTLNTYSTGLSSIIVPDSATQFYCYDNPLLKSVTLRGYANGNGLLFIRKNNALRSVDLSLVRPSGLQVWQNASLSAITFGSAISSTNLTYVYATDNSLSAIDMSSLSLSSLYMLNVSYNKLTSIIMPAGFISRAGSIGTYDITYNQLNTTALNNFFTNLGTYAGSRDQYGVGGTILISGNPGAATCNTSIATAKGWQPQN